MIKFCVGVKYIDLKQFKFLLTSKTAAPYCLKYVLTIFTVKIKIKIQDAFKYFSPDLFFLQPVTAPLQKCELLLLLLLRKKGLIVSKDTKELLTQREHFFLSLRLCCISITNKFDTKTPLSSCCCFFCHILSTDAARPRTLAL